MHRQVIAIDIDDVLSATAEAFAKYSNKQWGHNLQASDYLEDWAVVWGVSATEAAKRADHIHTVGMYGTSCHFEDAVPVLRRIKKHYDLTVVTSRRIALKPETDRWLQRYFPGMFDAIHYAGIWDTMADAKHKLLQTKTEICRAIGADYLIDDQVKHCNGAAQAGLTALLFGDYRWNRSEQLVSGVIRVSNWAAVEAYFDAKS